MKVGLTPKPWMRPGAAHIQTHRRKYACFKVGISLLFQLALEKSYKLCQPSSTQFKPLSHVCHPSLPPLHLYFKGKCSHGGTFDRTSRKDPVGGISKDDTGSSHGFLHQNAVTLALNATVELLEDIRLSVGDKNFLRCQQ